MASDWVTAAFTLAGSGLTGTLALAGARAQRWQTRTQLAAENRQRIEDVRKEGYVRFLAAGSAFATAWWHLLEQPTRGTKDDDPRGPLYDQVMHGWTELEQATSVVLVIGPSQASKSAYSTKIALMDLDKLSTALYMKLVGNADEPDLAVLREDLQNQRERCAFALAEFAAAAQEVLDLQ
jgi:hypothetical protein